MVETQTGGGDEPTSRISLSVDADAIRCACCKEEIWVGEDVPAEVFGALARGGRS